jgi:hypothetical protein
MQLYSETNKMNYFIRLYSTTVLYMFRTDMPVIMSYLSLYMQLFVHNMLTVTSC